MVQIITFTEIAHNSQGVKKIFNFVAFKTVKWITGTITNKFKEDGLNLLTTVASRKTTKHQQSLQIS